MCDAAQATSDALLSQALLPILAAGDSVVAPQPHSNPASTGGAQLCWGSADPGTSGQQGSAEDALLAVLCFVAGERKCAVVSGHTWYGLGSTGPFAQHPCEVSRQ